jgi:protein-tyrosine-phosphatase
MRLRPCRGGRVTAVTERVRNVLFLCTGNAARSILAEVLIDRWGGGHFKGYSAGSFPKGTVHPMTLELLASVRMPHDGLRSKSWGEFALPGAPVMDFVITVCDQAAGEICPIWSGQPVTAHWGIPDPATVEGPESVQRQAFRAAFIMLQRRIQLFVSLPLDKLDRLALKGKMDDIGRVSADAPADQAS